MKYLLEPSPTMISVSKYAFVLILISLVLVNVTAAMGQTRWTRFGSAPILPTPSWAPGGIFRPRAEYDGQTFRMWFSGLDSNGNPSGIGYATSTDGMKWVENTQPVMTAAGTDWEGNYISVGSVIWTGSEFMMWYRGVGGRAGSGQASGGVGLATSPDGVTWTKYFANPVMIPTVVDSAFISNPYVIQVGSSYKMWYACSSSSGLSTTAICYAASTDGINWVKQSSAVLVGSLPWEVGDLYSPSVIYNGTTYEMWYTGDNQTGSSQIGYATSNDGIAWTPSSNNPIFGAGPAGAWDAGGVGNQCVVQFGGGFLLYYTGYGTSKTSLDYIGLLQSSGG